MRYFVTVDRKAIAETDRVADLLIALGFIETDKQTFMMAWRLEDAQSWERIRASERQTRPSDEKG